MFLYWRVSVREPRIVPSPAPPHPGPSASKRIKNTAGRLRIAIVIDDIAGRLSDVSKLDDFLSLGIPITFSILPMEKTTSKCAEKIHSAHEEIILHQPMEPENMKSNNPGKAALLVGMSKEKIEVMFRRDLKNVPYAIGASNHMGSRFTSSPKEMSYLFCAYSDLKAVPAFRDIFFFDSYTSPGSVALRLAPESGVRALRNDLFLDDSDKLDVILSQLRNLKKIAVKRGTAAAIGHIQRKYMASALRKAIPEFEKEGVEFVFLSSLVGKMK